MPLVNTHQRVLVDTSAKRDGKTVYSARTDTNKLVHFESDLDLVGKVVEVKIIKAAPYNFFAEI
jgi:tRNA A37 methylthiotransferase MiaB